MNLSIKRKTLFYNEVINSVSKADTFFILRMLKGMDDQDFLLLIVTCKCNGYATLNVELDVKPGM